MTGVTIRLDPARGKGYAAFCGRCDWWTGWALGVGRTASSARSHTQLCRVGTEESGGGR